jgi:hypothetical protein
MIALSVSVLVTPLAIRFGKQRRHPGFLKAVALLATLVNVLWVPSQFDSDSHVRNVVIFFLIGWLATFKTIGCAFGRGPLCADTLTLLGTYVTYTLPVNPAMAGTGPKKRKSTVTYAWDAMRHLILLIGGTALSHRLQRLPYGPTGAVHMLSSDLADAVNLYAFIAVIMNVASVFTNQEGERVLGFSEIMAHCDRPWLATSFGEFWARRWNVNTGYTLRYLCYDPICDGSMTNIFTRPRRRRCSDARRVVAVATTFAVSGLVHECFIYWMRGVHSGHGRWFLFFFLQTPLIVVVDPWLKSLKRLTGPWVARALTVGGLLALAHYLFFVPVVQLGITDDIHNGVNHGIRMLLSQSLFQGLYPDPDTH